MTSFSYDEIPESVRQSILAATYKMAQEIFRDPEVVKEYENWLRWKEKRKQNKV